MTLEPPSKSSSATHALYLPSILAISTEPTLFSGGNVYLELQRVGLSGKEMSAQRVWDIGEECGSSSEWNYHLKNHLCKCAKAPSWALSSHVYQIWIDGGRVNS